MKTVNWREGVNIFIHIGNNISVLEDDIILILDKNSLSWSKDNLDLINGLIEKEKVVNQIDDEIKSYILVNNRKQGNKELVLYLSNISTISLMNRKRM